MQQSNMGGQMGNLMNMLGGAGQNLGPDDWKQAQNIWKMLDEMHESDPNVGYSFLSLKFMYPELQEICG